MSMAAEQSPPGIDEQFITIITLIRLEQQRNSMTCGTFIAVTT